MKKIYSFIYLLVLLCFPRLALSGNLFSISEILDSVYGITYFEKFNPQVGGTDIRLDDNGIPCESTVIDFYDDGSILHRGTYVNGVLITYKNYFPDGKLERKFKGLAGGRYSLETFYQTGLLRSKIVYFRKDALVWNEYYANGQIEFTEKYNSRFLLLYRKSYSEDGKPQTIFELINKKKNVYSHKEYFENGAMREEGGMVFSDDIVDFKREGTWRIYDETGKLVRLEEYVHGEFNSESQANASASNTADVASKNKSTIQLSVEEIDSFFEEEEEDSTQETEKRKKKRK